MAGALLHIHIAKLICSEFKKRAAENLAAGSVNNNPYNINENALLLGAMAPDIGVFPGSVSLISDLAHYYKSGDLIELLFKKADSNIKYSFMVGWLSHYYADALIHPLINQAVGELLHDERLQAVDYILSPMDHQRVEQGLDGYLYYDLNLGDKFYPELECEILESDYLVQVFNEFYGVNFKSNAFKSSFESARIYSSILSELACIQASSFFKKPIYFGFYKTYILKYLPAKFLAKMLGRKFSHWGIVSVVKPSAWLVDESKQAVNQLISQVIDYVSSENKKIKNLNLDNGQAEFGLGHPTFNRIQQQIIEFSSKF